MITLKRSAERRHSRTASGELWETFGFGTDPSRPGFRTLESLTERVLAPGADAVMKCAAGLDILTYVLEGSVTQEDSGGDRRPLGQGEWGRAGAPPESTHRAANGSATEPARIFQCGFTPDRSLLRTRSENRRFPMAERRGVLRLVFSPDGRNASLRLRQSAEVYSSVLDPGHHVVHELKGGRAAWLQVLCGRIRLDEGFLGGGDGASVVDESAVSITAVGPSEIVLVDVQ